MAPQKRDLMDSPLFLWYLEAVQHVALIPFIWEKVWKKFSLKVLVESSVEYCNYKGSSPGYCELILLVVSLNNGKKGRERRAGFGPIADI